MKQWMAAGSRASVVAAGTLLLGALALGLALVLALREQREVWELRLEAMVDERARAAQLLLDERLADAELVAAFPTVIALASGRPGFGGGSPELDVVHMTGILDRVAAGSAGTRIVVLDRQGSPLVGSSAPPVLGARGEEVVAAVRATGQPRVALELDATGRAVILALAPVATAAEPPVAVAVVEADAAAALLPLFGLEGFGLESAVLRLVRSRGDSSEAVAAGELGVVTFRPLPPQPTGSVLTSQPRTLLDWQLRAEVGREEAFAGFRRVRWVGAVAVLLLAAIAGVVASLIESRSRLGASQRTVAEARRLREHLDAITRAAPVLLLEIEAARTVTWANRGDFGVAPGARAGGDLSSLLAPAARAAVMKAVERTHSTRRSNQIEVTLADEWGVERQLAVSSRPLDLQERGPGVLLTAVDVTETIRAQRAVREHELTLRALFDANVVGIFAGSADGLVVEANDELLRVLGRSRDDLEAGLVRVPEPNDRSHSIENAERSLPVDTAYEVELQRPDATWAWVLCGHALADPDSARTIGFVLDVSARKAAELALAEEKHLLEERVAERTSELESFSYSVSHDLRAPLRAIDGFSRILQQEYSTVLNEEGRRLLGVIRAGCQRMGELIDALLALSRAARAELSQQPVDMTRLARETAAEVAAVEEDAGVSWSIAELPSVVGDASLLRQVWANLLSNAAKFSRFSAERRVVVSAATHGEEVVFEVLDTGVGLPVADVDKVFDPFTRLDTQERYPGAGIGLALVRRIIARHGGRVWAEPRGGPDGSSPGDGTRFLFRLPRGGAVPPAEELG